MKKMTKAEQEIQAVYNELKIRGGVWHSGCGWYFGTDARTIKSLKVLISRGLVEIQPKVIHRPALSKNKFSWVAITIDSYRLVA